MQLEFEEVEAVMTGSVCKRAFTELDPEHRHGADGCMHQTSVLLLNMQLCRVKIW